MKRFLYGSLVFGVLILLMGLAGPADAEMQPGLWEITAEFEMSGMPMAMNMPPMVRTQCLTEADVVPAATQPGQECKVTNIDIRGDAVSYDIVCDAQGSRMTGHGSAVYKDDTMSGTMDMTVTGAQQMTMKTTYTGKRLGDCP